jgi:hypothetical protein
MTTDSGGKPTGGQRRADPLLAVRDKAALLRGGHEGCVFEFFFSPRIFIPARHTCKVTRAYARA